MQAIYKRSISFTVNRLIIALVLMLPYISINDKSPFKILGLPWFIFGLIIVMRVTMNHISKSVTLLDNSIKIKTGILKRSIVEIPYAKIQSIELKTHLGLYDSILISNGENDKIEEFGLKDSKLIRDTLNSKINKTLANTTISTKNPIAVNVVGNVEDRNIDALSKLADLKVKGLITQEEFDKEKSKIINN